MTSPFHQKIRLALSNPTLQSALDNNAERRNTARRTVYQSLPTDLQTMRRRAHALREEVIEHLDQYLSEFIRNAQSNGWIVHRADTAQQAVAIVLEIIKSHKAQRVAKSKSMVSEEIELNPALEKAGIEVIETDLGEYIVQLRNEHPAHIITPAVHLTRQQVGELFHEKFGLPPTDDVPTMTATARSVLREVFLSADVGLSGVNFGVAENGMICIVTNEGNGRMVTTLPPVHIALMGVERLVPTLEHLALMLYLLPRSATGQKLTVYTSLIRGPSQDGDGCRERHLVLVDNGRLALRRTSLKEALYCIRCGACFNACPIFREIGGHSYVGTNGKHTPYGGPIGSVLSAGLFGYAEFGHLARASSLCGACREACPVDIDLPKLLLRVRAGQIQSGTKTQSHHPNAPWFLKIGLRLFSMIASSDRLFSLAQRTMGLAARFLLPKNDWMPLPSFTGWGYSKDFPKPAAKPFRNVWHELEATAVETAIPSVSPEDHRESPSPPSHPTNLMEWFAQELQALGGEFISCTSSEVGKKLLEFLQQHQINQLQVWHKHYLPAGLTEFLEQNGIKTTPQANPQLKAGLTGMECAIAESGTLVLPSDRERPLTASLLPEIHLAILRKDDILPRLPEALRRQETFKSPVTVLISGPSRTADIEMTLTIGVHGPKRVVVFCLD
ncbi:MAG: hypothetical protein DDG59_02770 [Anaerolineae bacterium]|nr:MAG: hypothetical protein DDG59_02770 [Anaerolineae bacterium]